MNNAKRKPILFILITVLLLIVAYETIQVFKFHIVSTDPKLSGVSDLATYMDIDFNKTLTGSGSITSQPDLIQSYSIKGKTIHLDFKAKGNNKKYTVTLTNIQAVSGDSLSRVLSFKIKDIPFDKLSEAQQQGVVNSQDPYDPSLPTSDPLVQHLPYGDLDYKIDYLVDTKNNRPALEVQISVILAGADYKLSRPALEKVINERKQEALDYIKSLGLNPAKYDIQYIIPPH